MEKNKNKNGRFGISQLLAQTPMSDGIKFLDQCMSNPTTRFCLKSIIPSLGETDEDRMNILAEIGLYGSMKEADYIKVKDELMELNLTGGDICFIALVDMLRDLLSGKDKFLAAIINNQIKKNRK